ncbi:MAG: hypothetical protein K6E41_00450 [Solobacterium sp.]|nr:hypothetical protein [Solobacterium sp.]
MDRKDRFSRFCFQGGFTCEKTEAATAVLVLAGAGELYTIDYEDQQKAPAYAGSAAGWRITADERQAACHTLRR